MVLAKTVALENAEMKQVIGRDVVQIIGVEKGELLCGNERSIIVVELQGQWFVVKSGDFYNRLPGGSGRDDRIFQQLTSVGGHG